MNNAEIIYNGNYLIISNFLYHKGDQYYNCSFDLKVKSGDFCGIAPCEYNMKDFKVFADDICGIYSFKKKNAVLNDICYGSTVDFKADSSGHIEITGEIYGFAMEHSLKFSFSVDQTVLPEFIAGIQKIIE